MITSERMSVVDANAEYLGVSADKLMENAGAGVARAVERVTMGNPEKEITVFAGKGNNGGDAFVAARFLQEYDPKVYLLGRSSGIHTETARDNYEALVGSGVDVEEVRDSSQVPDVDADVVLDGVLGTGVSGGLREPVSTAVEAINSSDSEIVSVDIPTGVDPDTGKGSERVEADTVVTFHDFKPAHTEIDANVDVVDIGIPDAAEEFVGEGDLQLLGRDPDSHKGDNGKVLVVGGGPYTGAPTLTATAALRAGCDWVTVAAPESVAETVQSYSPNLIVRELDGERLSPENVEYVSQLADGHDTVVVGPGLGDADETVEAAAEILREVESAVVDADAIRSLSQVETSGKEVIATPHAGELSSLGVDVPDSWEKRKDVVERFADKEGITVLLKGRYDVVSDGETTRVSRTGNPGMTVGGTGDVLAGVCGFLLSELDSLDAAGIGGFVNGRAGDLAYEDEGNGLVATDVVECLPEAMRQYN
ncbi:MAG: NAD(P)H-hydrate dehydratase [Halobacteria archaeon]|nr:NAD(P)H-hydrate dehydratase [Halobacteria archaeon]